MSGCENTTEATGEVRKIEHNRWEWALLTLTICLIIGVRLRMLDLPLDRDEGDYAYGAQLMLQGLLPYVDFQTMRLPGIYVVYSSILAVFGQTASAIHLGLLITNVITIGFVALLATRLYEARVGIAAGVAFALLTLPTATRGLTSNSEHFILLFAMAGLAGLFAAKRPVVWISIASGVAMGVSFVIKQHGAVFIIIGLVAVCQRAWNHATEKRRAIMVHGGAYSIATSLPFIAVCVYIAMRGIFEDFWFWTFTVAGAYASTISLSKGMELLANILPSLVAPVIPIWLLACVGLASPLWAKKQRENQPFLLVFLALSLAMVSIGLYFRPHYFLLMFPVLAILSGAGVVRLCELAKSQAKSSSMIGAALVLMVAFTLVHEREDLFQSTTTEVLRKAYGVQLFPEAPEIARYIQMNTSPEDRILVLGSEAEIYFYAQRRAATIYVYVYPLMENHPYALKMQKEMIERAERDSPKFVVLIMEHKSWLTRTDSQTLLTEWMDSFLNEHYTWHGLVNISSPDTIGDFYWGEEIKGVQPTNAHAAIFKRNSPGKS